MPQIDLEPKDYSATSVKGEAVFRQGGLRKLFLWLALIAALIGLRYVFEMALLPFVAPAAEAVTRLFFN
jgi:hypothetical protein